MTNQVNVVKRDIFYTNWQKFWLEVSVFKGKINALCATAASMNYFKLFGDYLAIYI